MLQYPNTRRWLLIGALAAGAALVFGSGLLAANAFDDDPAPSPGGSAKPLPAVDTPGGSLRVGPSGGEGQAGSGQAPGTSSGRGADMAIFGGCGGVLGSIISGGTIDLSREGLTPRFLGAGFALRGLSVHPGGTCEREVPNLEKAPPVLTTQWLHVETGLDVSIGQQLATEPVANVIDGTFATFTSGPYAFHVWVGGGIAVDLPLAQDDGPTTAGSPPSVGQQPDPRSLALLQQVIAALAPELGPQCFHQVTLAGWEGLPSLGIGDPRPAIPAEYRQETVEIRTLIPAQSACGNTAPATALPRSLNATFVLETQGSFGALFVGAFAVQPGHQLFAGHLHEYGANWSDAKYMYNVGAKSEVPLSRDVVVAIARAMDPGFDRRCMQSPRTLSAVEVAAAGFRIPSAPGYRISRSSFQAAQLQGDCAGVSPGGEYAEYSLSWTLEHESGATTIDVNVVRLSGPTETAGHISNFGLSWTNGRGDHFNVYGQTSGVSPTPPRDDLVAVAKSLDPTLDVDKLEQGVDKPRPFPVPPDQPKPER